MASKTVIRYRDNVTVGRASRALREASAAAGPTGAVLARRDRYTGLWVPSHQGEAGGVVVYVETTTKDRTW